MSSSSAGRALMCLVRPEDENTDANTKEAEAAEGGKES